MARLYVQNWKIGLKLTKQPVQKLPRVGVSRLRSWGLVSEITVEVTTLPPAQENLCLMQVLDLFLYNFELSSVQNSSYWKELSYID